MDKILTVVIPTYNMERYLRYCLDSLCVGRGSDALEVLVIMMEVQIPLRPLPMNMSRSLQVYSE